MESLLGQDGDNCVESVLTVVEKGGEVVEKRGMSMGVASQGESKNGRGMALSTPFHTVSTWFPTHGVEKEGLEEEVAAGCVCCMKGRRGRCRVCRDERWREAFCICFRRGLSARDEEVACCRCFMAGRRLHREAPVTERLGLEV